MIAAIAYPEKVSPGRGNKGCATRHFPMIDKGRVMHASAVVEYAKELVPQVIAYPEKQGPARGEKSSARTFSYGCKAENSDGARHAQRQK
jgi:hypothetical protein